MHRTKTEPRRPHTDPRSHPRLRDDAVLRQFPFDTIRPARILFEAYHLGQARFQRLAEYLRSWGYEMLGGSVQDYISTWHHINSTEVLAATATP